MPLMTLKSVPKKKLEGVDCMGLTHVTVTIRNFLTRDAFTLKFLIDTGSTESMVPASELRKIGIEPRMTRSYELANGQLEDYDIGVAEISFLDETIYGEVLFGPDDAEPLLGALALQSAGIILDTRNETISKLPARPLKAVAETANL
jgi:clan AA aspartic protease